MFKQNCLEKNNPSESVEKIGVTDLLFEKNYTVLGMFVSKRKKIRNFLKMCISALASS